MTEKELRQKVVDTAVSYLGCKEANGSHRKIIDLYNSHKPGQGLCGEIHGCLVLHLCIRCGHRLRPHGHHPHGVRM